MSKRFIVRDALGAQSLDLISTADRRRRERWIVYDTVEHRDVSDGYASKRAANGEASDLNKAAKSNTPQEGIAMPQARKKPAAKSAAEVPTLSPEDKAAARAENAQTNSTPDPVRAAIQARMQEIVTAQQPTRDEIERLKATLSEGAEELNRLQSAIDALNGRPSAVRRPRATDSANTGNAGGGTRSTASAEERNVAIIAYLAAHPDGATGAEITEHVPGSYATVTAALKELKDAGKIGHNGKTQRASRYLPA